MRKALLLIFTVLCSLTAAAQWGADTDLGVQPVPVGTNEYASQYVVGADGTIWFYYYHPAMGNFCEIYLQAIDKDGKLKFGEKGMMISNYLNLSWTEVNQYLYANSDGSVTLVVRDLRNSNDEDRFMTYTAYRISPEGKQLWGEDGVNLDEAMQQEEACCMTFCELSDGSTAFAWQKNYGQGMCIEIQKVSKDGKCLYALDDTRLCKTNGFYKYPYMVPSADGSFIIVYAYSSEQYLRAMRFNSDGTKAWDAEVKIYNGGWGSVDALQSRMHVSPGPDNGVIVTWNDDRLTDGFYSPYIVYIQKDGTSKFTNEEGKPDMKLTYDSLSSYPPMIAVEPDGKAIYCIFNQFNQAYQQYQQITLQKIDMNGQLLYGDYGKQIVPLQSEVDLGETSIQLGKDGQIGCFYQMFYDYHNIKNMLSICNTADGSPVNAETPDIMWRASNHYRYNLVTSRLTDNTWLAYWKDDINGSQNDSPTLSHCFTKFNFDGTEVNVPADIKTVTNVAQNNTYIYNVVGQRVNDNYKGIIIKNGKKVLK